MSPHYNYIFLALFGLQSRQVAKTFVQNTLMLRGAEAASIELSSYLSSREPVRLQLFATY